MNFGDRLRTYRLLRGLAQEDLCKLTGQDQSALFRIEKGTSGVPKLGTIQKFEEALHLTFHHNLMGDPHGHNGLYRPVSPYKTVPRNMLDKTTESLKAGLPGFLAELGLTQAHWYHCEMGSIVAISGPDNKILIVLPAVMRDALRGIINEAGLVTNDEISEELYLAALVNPVTAVEREDLPEGLKGPWETAVAELYQPPRVVTRVCFELPGDPEESMEAIEGRMKAILVVRGGLKVSNLDVEPARDFREALPAEIKDCLAGWGKMIDPQGNIINK